MAVRHRCDNAQMSLCAAMLISFYNVKSHFYHAVAYRRHRLSSSALIYKLWHGTAAMMRICRAALFLL